MNSLSLRKNAEAPLVSWWAFIQVLCASGRVYLLKDHAHSKISVTTTVRNLQIS